MRASSDIGRRVSTIPNFRLALRRPPGVVKTPTKNSAARSSRLLRVKCQSTQALQVVFVSTEVMPWSKSGGLADVLSGLPAALAARGHRVMTVSPRYSDYADTVDSGVRAPVCLGQVHAGPPSRPPLSGSSFHGPSAAGSNGFSKEPIAHPPVKFYMSDQGDGVDHVLVDHPIFKDSHAEYTAPTACDTVYQHTIPPSAVDSPLPALNPDAPYCIGPACDNDTLQLRNSVLCQAALAAPVLLWPASDSLSAEDQHELATLQQQMQMQAPGGGTEVSQAWGMTHGVARPASLAPSGQGLTGATPELLERLRQLQAKQQAALAAFELHAGPHGQAAAAEQAAGHQLASSNGHHATASSKAHHSIDTSSDGHASSNGHHSTASSNGHHATASSSNGHHATASSSNGHHSTASSNGHHSTASSSNDHHSTASSNGHHSTACSSDGHHSTASSNGHHATASSSNGHHATASSSNGHHATASSSNGHHSTASSNGHHSTASSNGHHSTASSSNGHHSTASSNGHHSTACSSDGHHSTASSDGHHSTASSNGHHATASSSNGHHATASSSNGHHATASSSNGHHSTASSNGHHSTACSSDGHHSTASSNGHHSTASSNGHHATANSSNGQYVTAGGTKPPDTASGWPGQADGSPAVMDMSEQGYVPPAGSPGAVVGWAGGGHPSSAAEAWNSTTDSYDVTEPVGGGQLMAMYRSHVNGKPAAIAPATDPEAPVMQPGSTASAATAPATGTAAAASGRVAAGQGDVKLPTVYTNKIIFVGNDWPTGLLALWLQAGKELLESPEGTQRLLAVAQQAHRRRRGPDGDLQVQLLQEQLALHEQQQLATQAAEVLSDDLAAATATAEAAATQVAAGKGEAAAAGLLPARDQLVAATATSGARAEQAAPDGARDEDESDDDAGSDDGGGSGGGGVDMEVQQLPEPQLEIVQQVVAQSVLAAASVPPPAAAPLGSSTGSEHPLAHPGSDGRGSGRHGAVVDNRPPIKRLVLRSAARHDRVRPAAKAPRAKPLRATQASTPTAVTTDTTITDALSVQATTFQPAEESSTRGAAWAGTVGTTPSVVSASTHTGAQVSGDPAGVPMFVDLTPDQVQAGFESAAASSSMDTAVPVLLWRSSPAVPSSVAAEEEVPSVPPPVPDDGMPGPPLPPPSPGKVASSPAAAGAVTGAAVASVVPPAPPAAALHTLAEKTAASALAANGNAPVVATAGSLASPAVPVAGAAAASAPPAAAAPAAGAAPSKDVDKWAAQRRLQQALSSRQQEASAMRGAARRLTAFQKLVAKRLKGSKFAVALHNVAYQGLFQPATFDKLGLPAMALDALLTSAPQPTLAFAAGGGGGAGAQMGKSGGGPARSPAAMAAAGLPQPPGLLSWLQGAVETSDLILTVSPSYAEELLMQAEQALDQQIQQVQRAAEESARKMREAEREVLDAQEQLRLAAEASFQQLQEAQEEAERAEYELRMKLANLAVSKRRAAVKQLTDRSQGNGDKVAAELRQADLATKAARLGTPKQQQQPAMSTGVTINPHTQRLFAAVRRKGVVGIMNGVDLKKWDPQTDPYLPRSLRYSLVDVHEKKAAAKAFLQRRLGLAQDPDAPLVAFIGRLEDQKGADALLSALPHILGPSAPAVIDPRTGNNAVTTAGPPAGVSNNIVARPPSATLSLVPRSRPPTAARKTKLSRVRAGTARKRGAPAPAGQDPPVVAHVGPLEGAGKAPAASPLVAPGSPQVVLVGSGNPWQEQCLAQLSQAWPGRAVGSPGFNEPLAHMLMAAADFLVVPSRYEPCGLVALSALRYGTIPVVTPVGGLPAAAGAVPSVPAPDNDALTVWEVPDAVQEPEGFVTDTPVGGADDPAAFRDGVLSLVRALRAALAEHGSEGFLHRRERCMRRDVAWDRSAAAWEAVLATLVEEEGNSDEEK